MENNHQLPAELPIIEINELVYPFSIVPIFLEKKRDIEKVQEAMEKNLPLFVAVKVEEGEYGTLGTIIRKVQVEKGKVKILFQGVNRGKIEKLKESGDYGLISPVEPIEGDPREIQILVDELKEVIREYNKINAHFPLEFIKILESNRPDRAVDIIVSSLKLEFDKGYSIFKEREVKARLVKLLSYLKEEIETFKIRNELSKKVMEEVQEANREHILRQQLKIIQRELGLTTEFEEETQEYWKKLEELKPHMPEGAYKEIKKQIERLQRMHPDMAEATVTQNYIEWALEVPFGKYAREEFDIKELKARLDKDHYGLKKPKERIIEHFAAKELAEKRGKEFSGAILCFVGPPGVGKTSLANSIAKALDRELVRIALGGLEDVNELRGHRRTYIGSMPGRIAQGLIQAKEMNPVMVLDEIDKIARYKGDPTAVLLEILDPEQNSKFRDLYLNFDIDLSKVLFIATANNPSTIPAPLRDRMELIYIDSYTPYEKLQIAKRYLIPQEMEKHSLKKSEISISDRALEEIIDKYTKEAGVRELRRIIAKIMRRVAVELLEGKKQVRVTIRNLKEFLKRKYSGIEPIDKKPKVGVVHGLAWTPVGGDILPIEAVKYRGKGAITITGHLGDVMKESAHIAFTLVKVLLDNKKLKPKEGKVTKKGVPIYSLYNLHIHFPEGAIPKDGPSAGIAITTALASLFSGKKVRGDLAMTGEITLTGEVLPVGGIREKLIAAYKAKISEVLLPVKNYERDLEELPDEVKEGLKITPVKRIEEVLEKALI